MGLKSWTFFPAYEDAIQAGYQKFGLEPFLVEQINAIAAIPYITRHSVPVADVKAN